ncbi:MAG: hypothetical protein FWD65_07445 [Coriobacteriia bacterium]|nr:hypothetical protein [Coriobacteriia bacterium]
MARTVPSSYQQQASRAFGQLVRGINDAQLRALMRAVFYRAGRYQAFCQAPLAATGADACAGSAIRHAIRSGRLLRAVAGSFAPQTRDLMLAATLLMGVGAIEAFEAQGSPRLTPRGRLYPVAVLSTLIVHDVRCTIDRNKREALEGLILRAAAFAGEPGVPAPEELGAGEFLQHEGRVVALCVQLDRFAETAQPASLAVRWSQPTSERRSAQRGTATLRQQPAPHLTLVGQRRKEDDDNTIEPRLAAG